MKRILYLLQKEFIQVFRNKTMLPIIFVVPLFQMLLLVFAATLEMKNIHWLLIDQDQTQTSRELVAKFNASPFMFSVEVKLQPKRLSSIFTTIRPI